MVEKRTHIMLRYTQSKTTSKLLLKVITPPPPQKIRLYFILYEINNDLLQTECLFYDCNMLKR